MKFASCFCIIAVKFHKHHRKSVSNMNLTFDLLSAQGPDSLHIEVNQLVVAGWTGRDINAVEHHISELEALNVPRPSAVPLFYRVATNQLSQADTVEVVGAQTSGEVEPLLFTHGGELFVSIASDHTDRELEAHSVALSKQICVKPVARSAWRLGDVIAHWDELQIRSWVEEEDGEFRLYQEGRLSALRPPAELMARYLGDGTQPADGFAMSCGTVGAIGGIRAASHFRMELLDERRGRRITHSYRSRVLPVVA